MTPVGVSDIRSYLNELESNVAEIKIQIERLENSKGFEIIKDEIIELQESIDKYRRKKFFLSSQKERLLGMNDKVYMNTEEIKKIL